MINNADKIYIEKQYKKLLELKKAFGINDSEEVSKTILLSIAKEHNLKEISLLNYIVSQMRILPIEVKDRYNYLVENENQENFIDIYNATELLFKKDIIFQNFYEKFECEFEFKDFPMSVYYFNMMIFAVCYHEIEDISLFSSDNPIINLYLLEKWLKKIPAIRKIKLTNIEKVIINLLLKENYSPNDIVHYKMIEGINDEVIIDIIENILPAKFNVDDIIQALAIYIYNY